LQNNRFEKISGVPILINLKDGGYYFLSETAMFILNCLRQGYATQQISKKVSEDYEISFPQALNDVNKFMKKLKRAGFFKQ